MTVKPDYKIKNIEEVINSAHEVINYVKFLFSDRIYAKSNKNFSMQWSTVPSFSASASVKKMNVESHAICISYESAWLIYQEAAALPFICKYKIPIDGQKEVFNKIKFGRADCPALPNDLNDEEIVDRVFRSTLAWVYLHEQAHLFQCHGEVGGVINNIINTQYSIIEENMQIHDSAFNSITSHLLEFSADYEATQYIFPVILNGGKTLHQSDLWCLVVGISCLFHRFFRYGNQKIKSTVEGTHPNPTLRLHLFLRAISEILQNPHYRSYVPWMDDDANNLYDLIIHATVTASMFRKVAFQGVVEEFKFLDATLYSGYLPQDYLDQLTTSWGVIQPVIKSKYFGFALGSIMPIIDFANLNNRVREMPDGESFET